ncbi:PAS domain-containing protein [Pedobacter duraquae]|uniref:histidine kinase n=1 Tax=Pedobacter duraquae TaxID=425511 RepID=A0A4R6IRL1_9SPHI|nr:PAS domain-containing protein [Pedobacter duraquae]TDO24851.1 PAS domain S-box-containing protein [Pedobacter duraquae]
MSKRSIVWIILFYLTIGLVWLVGGNLFINRIYPDITSANAQYLYALKNIIFLFISIVSCIFFLNSYYKILLLKERSLNKQLRNSRDDLSELLHTYDLVTKATSDVIWDYDIVKDELKWLTGYKALFGYEEDGARVRDAFWNMQRIHEEDRARVIRDFKKLIALKERNWIAEYRYYCKDGTFKYVIDRGYLILDQYGEPVRMVGAIQDIDLIKQYGLQLEVKNEKLKEIAWLNSHEIRRPLSNLLGLIPMLRSSTDNPESFNQFLDYIEQSARELDETVSKINEETA